MQAEIMAPTVDTLTWEEAVTFGSQAWESAEQSKWDLGDIGAIVAHKWQQDSVKKFANSIGMHDNPRRLYEYVSVAQFWTKDARAQFTGCSWSAFRETSRHGLSLERAIDAMKDYGELPVAVIRAAITGKPPRPAVTRVEFEAGWFGDDGMDWDVDIQDGQTIIDLKRVHPDATITVVVEYAVRPAADGAKGT